MRIWVYSSQGPGVRVRERISVNKGRRSSCCRHPLVGIGTLRAVVEANHRNELVFPFDTLVC